jgi:5-methylcytosine-specific restriction endonuclease McrA
MIWTPPTPEEQVLFLRNIQRLLAEGQFVASYKFALLHALADLAVLKGDDSGGTLPLGTRDIAETFIGLYWQQCRPFEIGGQSSGLVLQQNTGKQAAVIGDIIQSQQECGGSLFRLCQTAPDLWRSLIAEVDQTVRVMPLWKLQTVGNERLDFLYDNLDRGTTITLKPGVTYCLRAFYGLLRDLIQGAWVRFVQKLNADRLGNLTDLGTFLFGRERNALEAYRPILLDVQHGQCFYCHHDLHRQMEVDHFVPWSRYPTDLGHNFVLSHPSCNNAKSDHLAAESHLAAWIERNKINQDELHARLLEAAMPHDLSASIRVAEWAYEQTERARGQVWLEKAVFQHLGSGWRHVLVA